MMYPLSSKDILATMTANEVGRITDFENKWKIKTTESDSNHLSN